DLPRTRGPPRALRDARLRARRRRRADAGPQRTAAGRSLPRAAAARAPCLRACALTHSLRNRTVAVTILIVLVVAAVMAALLVAISRQRDAAESARHSQVVISAATRAEAALLGVQTTLRGYLVSANPDL